MNIRELEYVVALAELRHFGHAAARCHVSQPTLSGQLKKLEDELGVLLFERQGRSVMPTEVGHDVIAIAHNLLSDVSKIKQVAKASQDPFSGTFRCGSIPTVSNYVFPDLVQHSKNELPDLRLILIEEKTDQLLYQLKTGVIDAAILALPVIVETLESQLLFEDPFYLAVPDNHELASLTQVSEQQLGHHSLLLLEDGHCLRDQAIDICERVHANEALDCRATSLETLRQMVRAGTGITLMPGLAKQQDNGITYIPFAPPIPKRQIGLVWRKSSGRKPVIERMQSMLIR